MLERRPGVFSYSNGGDGDSWTLDSVRAYLRCVLPKTTEDVKQCGGRRVNISHMNISDYFGALFFVGVLYISCVDVTSNLQLL